MSETFSIDNNVFEIKVCFSLQVSLSFAILLYFQPFFWGAEKSPEDVGICPSLTCRFHFTFLHLYLITSLVLLMSARNILFVILYVINDFKYI